jgi:hypothetical protein
MNIEDKIIACWDDNPVIRDISPNKIGTPEE